MLIRGVPTPFGQLNEGDAMQSMFVAVVKESRHSGFSAGDFVAPGSGIVQSPWQRTWVASAEAVAQLTKVDLSLGVPAAYIGILGIAGLSAYFPALELGRPKPGETALVSAAAGSVGVYVGQIWKLMGCRVIGM